MEERGGAICRFGSTERKAWELCEPSRDGWAKRSDLPIHGEKDKHAPRFSDNVRPSNVFDEASTERQTRRKSPPSMQCDCLPEPSLGGTHLKTNAPQHGRRDELRVPVRSQRIRRRRVDEPQGILAERGIRSCLNRRVRIVHTRLHRLAIDEEDLVATSTLIRRPDIFRSIRFRPSLSEPTSATRLDSPPHDLRVLNIP